MSANIPFEIQEEIIKRVLPVKSLIWFRSVSKQWKSLIDSSEFITEHSVNPTPTHHLLITYVVDSKVNRYVSIVDDDSYPHHKSSPAVLPTVEPLPLVLGCSHGLVCLLPLLQRLVVFWNPSVRKSVGIVLPNGRYAFGFGVCPKTFDPKIVKISKIVKNSHFIEAEVFTLRYGVWRSIPVNLHPPGNSMRFSDNVVVKDGVIHWVAYNCEFERCHRIITFDLSSEEFGKVDLPDSLGGRGYLGISKLKESLAVLDFHVGGLVCDVWMMLKNCVLKSSFTKLFCVKVRCSSCLTGFRMNGQLMHEGNGELEVYEPSSEHMNGVGIYDLLFQMASYTESLLLLNHRDSIIHQ